ncbi:hypothetical protein ACNKF0_20985 [Nocardioides sp. T5]|uniref:hypothetical protein n=1 Tax=Nocardioides sp. T5 TaxID=3400182 RepID=UPI003A84D123
MTGYDPIKRALDVVVAGVVLAGSMPVQLVIAALVRVAGAGRAVPPSATGQGRARVRA